MAKKPALQIAFGYPRRGLEGLFNTFRLGVVAASKYPPGAVVDLVDSRSGKLLGRATVLNAHTGVLRDMADAHASNAHNWKGVAFTFDFERADALIASMKKRYPPGRVKDNSVTTVIYLQKIEDAPTEE
jgi:hypothetical protein